MKSITIRKPGEEHISSGIENIIDRKAEEEFLAAPVHDNGSVWYVVLGVFLPVVALILALIFKANKHYRNYKKCKKGAIAGFIIIGVILLLLLIGLLLVVI